LRFFFVYLFFFSDHIRYEDRETHYICIGPVNKALDMLVEFWASRREAEALGISGKGQGGGKGKEKAGGKGTEEEIFDALRQHRERVKDYLWLAADGMKMQARDFFFGLSEFFNFRRLAEFFQIFF
jgi:hypothetical protein